MKRSKVDETRIDVREHGEERLNTGTAQPPTPRIAILGAGISGLCMAIQLKKAGISSFTIYEKSNGVGGTWRDNTYPGAGCDVPSHLYSFSFESKADWSRKYAEQPEILQYLEQCAQKYGITPHIQFNTKIADARFDETEGVWRLCTGTGEEITVNILISGCGQLNRPNYPEIPGLDTFEGTTFHSARWNHQHDLAGKNVAVFGNGASAIQFIPHIAPKTKKLYVFQRSANWMIPKADRKYAPFEQWMFRHFPAVAWLYRYFLYLQLEKNFFAFFKGSRYSKQVENSTEQLLTKVSDPHLKDVLRPDYPVGCKRILISNDFYTSIQNPNVEVVTTPIKQVTREGVITSDDQSRPVDTIIFATGFEATTFLTPMKVEGLSSMTLETAWKEGAEAYLGVAVSGFPNFFMLYGPNTNLGHNSIIFMIECQVGYVVQCIQKLIDGNLLYLDVRREAMDQYNQELQENIKKSVWDASCKSWYKTETGKVTTNWPSFSAQYWWRTRRPNFSEYYQRPRF